jgi:arsenical-resistance protein 2
MPANEPEAPWYAAFPEPRSSPETVSRAEVRKWLEERTTSDHGDFALVDVRRNDHEVRWCRCRL